MTSIINAIACLRIFCSLLLILWIERNSFNKPFVVCIFNAMHYLFRKRNNMERMRHGPVQITLFWIIQKKRNRNRRESIISSLKRRRWIFDQSHISSDCIQNSRKRIIHPSINPIMVRVCEKQEVGVGPCIYFRFRCVYGLYKINFRYLV